MRRLLTVLLLACCAVGVGAGPAQAHNKLVGSDPADGARLAAGPSRVTLEFDQPARQGYAVVSVTGPGGGRFESGAATVQGVKVGIGVKPLGAAGEYVIGYRILSSDGHPVSGKITFTLTAAAAPAESVPAPSAGGDAAATPATSTADPESASEPAPATDATARPGAGPADQDLSAQAAEAAANGGAGMAIVWVVGALLLLGAGTIVALRRAGTSGPDSGPADSGSPDAGGGGDGHEGAGAVQRGGSV
ncbi:copper resistance CopC family protein [Nonomuraea sp. NPDC046570]|uniref:copper resistance CopC family protein n=1 Tax=Nonomuraea sp. NPDC046570 TaxID=3155255 RepID=UPI003400E24B